MTIGGGVEDVMVVLPALLATFANVLWACSVSKNRLIVKHALLQLALPLILQHISAKPNQRELLEVISGDHASSAMAAVRLATINFAIVLPVNMQYPQIWGIAKLARHRMKWIHQKWKIRLRVAAVQRRNRSQEVTAGSLAESPAQEAVIAARDSQVNVSVLVVHMLYPNIHTNRQRDGAVPKINAYQGATNGKDVPSVMVVKQMHPRIGASVLLACTVYQNPHIVCRASTRLKVIGANCVQQR